MKQAQKKSIETRVISNNRISPDHFVLTVRAPELAEAVPGQFVNIRVDERTTDPLLRVPLGVHRIERGMVSFLYKVTGRKTEMLSNIEERTSINMLGPLGNGFQAGGGQEEAVMVSGGHGIAPLYGLAEKLILQGTKVRFFIGASTGEHVLCEKELRGLGADVHIATDDGTRGFRGYVTELARQHLTARSLERGGPAVFACGPRAMLAVLSDLMKSKQLEGQFSLDAYMACGTGVCRGCAIQTKKGIRLVCKDGPVFDHDLIDWTKER